MLTNNVISFEQLDTEVCLNICLVVQLDLGHFSFAEIQRKLEQEQGLRKKAEEKLLEVEKAKSTLSFDYKQVQQQLQSLQTDLRNETEKVKLCASL